MVGLGIATGFERQYGVLKRLGATPLGRRAAVVAKDASVLAIEVAAVRRAGRRWPFALGWHPGSGWPSSLGAVLLGTIAFAGIGLLMAGTLARRGEPGRRQRPLPRAAAARRHGDPARQAAQSAYAELWRAPCPSGALSMPCTARSTQGCRCPRRVDRARRVGRSRAGGRRRDVPLGVATSVRTAPGTVSKARVTSS